MAQDIRKFVVVAMARSGTNALISALRQHKNCYTDFELFHDKLIPWPLGKRYTLEQRDADPHAFLDAALLECQQRKPAVQRYGFKIFFGQNDALMQQLIDDPDWPVILMRRENTLDQFISLEIAMATKEWNSSEGNKTLKTKLAVNDYLNFKKKTDGLYHACEESLALAGMPFFRFSYDDLVAGRFAPLCEFLGLPEPHDIAPKLKKQNPARTADKLENPDEVYAMLKREGLTHYWVD